MKVFSKVFSKQFQDCKKLNNMFLEGCTHCGHLMHMCLIYGGRCSSIKCKEDRMKLNNNQPLPKKRLNE